MKRLPILLCFIIITITSLTFPIPSFADEFSQAVVRLDKTQAESPLSGLVCATPSSPGAGAEAKVTFTFPNTFSINTAPTTWTASTANIPAGTYVWPGIGTQAIGVSGKTITFSSSDLTANVRYCFTFSGSGSLTGTAGQSLGVLKTRESNNTVIDSSDIGFPITDNDQVTITARVGAKPNDLITMISRTTSPWDPSQNQTLHYQITYGTSLPYPTTATVEADWSLGTIVGTRTPTLDIVHYVVGSASKGYGGAIPIVNLKDRKITWTVTLPPHATGQTVTFDMKTTDVFTDTHVGVDFIVSSRMESDETISPFSSIMDTYKYVTPPPGPTATPGPKPTAVPTITPSLFITNVALRTVSDTEASVLLQTSTDTSYTLSHGTSPTRLTKRLTGLQKRKAHTIDFSNLTPDTTYYFQLTVTDTNGRRRMSDIFTFTTASKASALHIIKDSLIATSEHIILLSNTTTNAKNTIVIPEGSPYEIQFTLADQPLIQSISLITRNHNVLGITSFADTNEPLSDSALMLETKPGVFTGRLKAPGAGNNEVYARIEDYNGAIAEEKLSDLRVIKPFTIREKRSQKPIEHAKVALSLYNARSKIYETISPQGLAIQNPAYSEPDGTVKIVLPQGQYRAEVENLQNEKQTVDFTIGPYSGQDYPTVYLDKTPFSIGNVIRYFITTCGDVLTSSHDFLANLGSSERFFELNMLAILACFVILSVFALAGRLHISVRHLPWYFSHLLFLHPRTGIEKTLIKGQVTDHATDAPVSGADIFVLDTSSGQIVLHTVTNRQGKFSIPITPLFTYRIEIAKQLYHPGHFQIHGEDTQALQTFSLVQHGTPLGITEKITTLTESLLGMSFELILFLTFILSILLGYSFGFQKVLPFLVLALCNLIFWLLHREHDKAYA